MNLSPSTAAMDGRNSPAAVEPAALPGATAGGGTSERYFDIDCAKGLAIALVVFGHIVARQPPAGAEWYMVAKNMIYAFHMAFFMFLSGVLFFMRLEPASSMGDYLQSSRKRFLRLMPAYFLFALLVFAGKWLAQDYAHAYVDNPVSGWNDIWLITVWPVRSISVFLWYVYVLFFMSIAAHAIYTLSRGDIRVVAAVGVVMLFFDPSGLLGMDLFCRFFFFFALGGLAIRYWQPYTRFIDRSWPIFLLLFAASLALGLQAHPTWLIVGTLSLPALHGLCRWLGKSPPAQALAWLGAMSFVIYLMNTMTIGATKALLLKFTTWDGVNFYFFIPVLLAAGLLLPILVKRMIFRHLPWLDRITN